MKIPLNVGQGTDLDHGTEQKGGLERDIIACKEGDWEAKVRLTNVFMRFLTSLARERSHDMASINEYVEAGKHGLLTAVRKYKPRGKVRRFQIFAVPYIEKSMERIDRRGKFLGFLRRG